MSKSKTRRVAAIGNSRVIPAQAGIHFAAIKKPVDSRLRGNDELGASAIARMSKSKTRRVAAIGNSRVIPAQVGIHFAAIKKPMDSRLRGNDELGRECNCADVQEQDPMGRSDWKQPRHPRAGGDPASLPTSLSCDKRHWVPAFAGTTIAYWTGIG